MASLDMLLRPLAYLRIRHERKTKFDLVIPATLAVLSTVGIALLPDRARLLGSGGLLEAISNLSIVLVGFFIAALAAVATFNKEDMDLPMAGEPPTLKQKFRGELIVRELTRRQFLCFLFGYLAFVSLMIAIAAIMAKLVQPAIAQAIHGCWWGSAIKYGSLFLFLLAFWNMVITTLIGLFYLTDRMHRPSPKWQPRSKQPGDLG